MHNIGYQECFFRSSFGKDMVELEVVITTSNIRTKLQKHLILKVELLEFCFGVKNKKQSL